MVIQWCALMSTLLTGNNWWKNGLNEPKLDIQSGLNGWMNR